jgi:hypothetical protein
MASLREQFFAGKGMGINPLMEDYADELDARMRASGSPYKLNLTPDEKAEKDAQYQQKIQGDTEAGIRNADQVNQRIVKRDAFEKFLNMNLPELAQKQKETQEIASWSGETIAAPEVPELTGDVAQDTQIAKEYMNRWFEAAGKRQIRPSGLGS